MAKHLVQHNTLPFIQEGLRKKEIFDLASRSVDSLLEDGNVFQVAEAIAAMEEFVKAVRKDNRYIEFLRDELLKNNGRHRTNSGAKLELCEAAVQYDYTHDATWRMIDEEIKLLEEQKKAREEVLRKIPAGRMAVDPETGEVLEGALKSSKSTYRITLAK